MTSQWWAAGLLPRERPAGDAPVWARFVAEVLAGLPVAVAPPADDLTGVEGLGRVLRPLVRHAVDGLGAAPEGVARGLAVRLERGLLRIAARCLVTELHACGARGDLTGDTPRRRFGSFVALLSGRAGLAGLFEGYPVLGRLLAQHCAQGVEVTAELLDRYAADRPLIVERLLGGVDPGPLVEVDAGAGDGHRGGRSVAVLRFAGGARVVYKPRPLAVHGLFNEVLDRLGLGLRPVRLVERDEYGWTEFIPVEPCAAPAEVRAFYRRQGALLALLYALDCTDVHYENLIAHRDQPVLIDLETLFHPELPMPTETGVDPAADALGSSVYRVALLPRVVVGDQTALDVSGLGGDAGVLSPFEGLDWEDPGTDRMRVTRRRRPFAGSDNRPRLGDDLPAPELYTEDLVAGFRTGYDAILAGRAALAALLPGFADADVRVVPRATRWYGRLLDETTHPDVLRDAADRHRVLAEQLAAASHDPVRAALIDQELAELWRGDVPLFTGRPGSTDLLGADGPVSPAGGASPMPMTGLDRVERKIAALSRTDRYDQEWIIRAAMATRHRTPLHVPAPPGPPAGWVAPDHDRLLAAARGIADRLVATAYESDGRVNWLGLEPLEDGYWTVAALGAALGSGYCGPALFLDQLATITGTDRYADLARRALVPLPALLDGLARIPELAAIVGPGAFTGFGGIAYTLSCLGPSLDDPGLVEQAVTLTGRAARECTDPGVASGLAGGLAAMLAVHAATGLSAALDTAVDCADRLLASPGTGFVDGSIWDGFAGGSAGGGFADGAAGVGWALGRLADELDAAEHRADAGEPGRGGERYRTAGLATLRSIEPSTMVDLSWCRGLSGWGLAAADPAAADLRSTAVSAVLQAPASADLGLCHGELAALELLATSPQAAQARLRRLGTLLAVVEQSGPTCGTPTGVQSPGLLHGLSGIGHGILLAGFGERLSSALLLQPPKR
ncbi:hypothetical protein Lfu02_56910 [Longispora fulva]|uniref:Type 2 lantibiotic biosynthesis protein LanM n=1 Tax=Longispora fulva TaxID=619741 RepID=A0A8J7KX47_9ACTN|nr:type 2 lanthipeptide synthetase LanM family protein [Longispora fulva]MBG6137327.1 type 2 lantibiotic biosynthesis protein LanM [Longispora fulva]GIG61319.1 hypothetical protein Lfu02_56910 [Longispora fulva]